jgi:hypothetical protein
MKLTADQQNKLNEATAAGDIEKVQALLSQFSESNKNGGAAPKREARGRKAETPSLDEDPEETDQLEESDEDEEEVDHDQELDDTAEAIKAAHGGGDDLEESDPDDPDDDDDIDEDDEDLEESDDPDEDDEVDEDDEDDEDIDESESANKRLKSAMKLGAQAIRAAAKRNPKNRQQLEESASVLSASGDMVTEISEKKKKGKKGISVSVVSTGAKPGPKVGRKGNLTVSVKGKQAVQGQKHFKMAESAADTKLRRRLAESEARNDRLSRQLKVRQGADRARKLLRESSIPEALRPKVLRELIVLDEEAMKARIEYHESLVDTILSEVRESAEMEEEFDPIEGAGTRTLRESFGGRNGGALDEGFFEECGLPLKRQ